MAALGVGDHFNTTTKVDCTCHLAAVALWIMLKSS